MQIHEIEQSMVWQEAESKVSALKKELHVLAAECKKAFVAGGLQDSSVSQVRKALELCSSYTKCSTDVMIKDKASPHIAELWKNDPGINETTTDKKQLATAVLGAGLVDTLTEDNHQPPDVSVACKPPKFCHL